MKNTCIVCGGEEFFPQRYMHVRSKIGHMHQTCIDLKKYLLSIEMKKIIQCFKKLQRNIVVDAVILCCIMNEHTKYNLVCFFKTLTKQADKVK